MDKTQNKYFTLLIYAALAITTVIAFEPVRHNDFVNYDDDKYVTDNPQVSGGITRQSIVWAFTSSYMANWHPLTWLSHMLDCNLFDLKPMGHHFTNLLFHIANTLLLFWVLKRMTAAIWPSAFVAAAFALHPIHVESVAWVAERKDVLSGFFWMLTMAVYIRYTELPNVRRYLLVFIALALGLMAKPMLVTLPFALLLLDYWPLERFQWGQQNNATSPKSKQPKVRILKMPLQHLIIEKIPLFLLVVISSVITYLAQQKGGAVARLEDIPLNYRIGNALVSYFAYLNKMIYPAELAVLYPCPAGLRIEYIIISFVKVAAVSAVILFMSRQRKYLAMGWLWYVGTLIPAIGLVQVGIQAMADRYTYLPSIGIFIMAAWGANELAAKLPYRKIAIGILAGLLVIAMLICTRIQVRYWQNNLTLFGHTLKITKNNFIMQNNYGNTLRKDGKLDEAITCFQEALRLNPEYLIARDNISQAFLAKGMFEDAITNYNELLRLEPNRPAALSNLGVALQKQGKINDAMEKWQKALAIEPYQPDALYNMGLALSIQAKYDQAVEHFLKALKVKPDWAEPYNDLGLAYARLGKYDLAIQNYNQALRLKPNYPEPLYNLGTIYYQQKKLDLTIAAWTETAKLKPDFADVFGNLAWILAANEDARIRNPANAVKYAEKACTLTNYERPKMLDTLAVAYAAAGKFPEAIETAQKAINLAEAAGRKDLVQEINKRIQLYKNGKPYTEPPPTQNTIVP